MADSCLFVKNSVYAPAGQIGAFPEGLPFYPERVYHAETGRAHGPMRHSCRQGGDLNQTEADEAMPAIDDIEKLLKDRRPHLMPRDNRTPTAVALILRDSPSGAQILFIERAHHERDPWSGNLGFPGGKVEEQDRDARRAAERETLEETGLNLAGNRYLGRLSDIAGAYLPVLISCFVYCLEVPATVTASGEVRSIFWVPFESLLDPAHHRTTWVRFSGKDLETPALMIPDREDTPLWGITYRLIMQFLAILGHDPSA
jgi:8-oxo-dGTP pyrophosphatase MutT (NUDIX family)